MRRLAALLVLGTGALLLSPGAVGVPDVPGDPTPPVVTPVIAGTLGDAGWYTTNVTVNWAISDPESIILSTSGCDTRTFNADTTGITLTCTAESDGGITSIGKTFKVDKTAPGATATPSRAADSNGWYNHDLSVDFNGNDGTSGLQSCSPDVAYAGPDTAATTVNGSCRDMAGNTSPASLPLKFDETAPQASAAAGRGADANGWYNHAVTVNFAGSDATSGVETCSQQTYAGPDDASVALAGTCRDRAGNVSGSAGFNLKYDETPPQASASPGRASDANGWYNHALAVSFTGSDVTSGLDVCDAAKTYSGPDNGSVSVSGSCRDHAGNVAPRSFALKYDATAPAVTATPARGPNANGWYTSAIGVTFAGSDSVSGVASCDAAKTYSGPDNASTSVGGNCIDTAGNAGAGALPIKYDATAPQASAAPGRTADANGWFNHALTVGFTGSDAISAVTCDAAKTYSGPDTVSTSVSGACRDAAGNSNSGSFSLKYDGTPPTVTSSADRAPNAAGWYRSPVTVGFTGGDATSGLESCEAAKTYSSPDSASASVAGTCRDRAANVGSASLALKYDATAPALTPAPSRAADANGWYNHPLTVSFPGTDATSGIATCTAAQSYSGPDNGTASISGSCSDTAGNTTPKTLALKYDATVPQVTAAPSRAVDANGWYNHALTVTFTGGDATSGIASCVAPTSYSGPDSAATSVSGTCQDTAGNAGSTGFALKYDGTAPALTPAPSRTADANGWYNHSLTVSFPGTDATSGIDVCTGQQTYAGPDNAGAAVAGSCSDKAGNATPRSFALKYDATAPSLAPAPSRAADANGWYNHALTVSFPGADLTSGIAACTPVQTYSAPDALSASVSGNCSDQAGNSTARTLAFNYDGTAPALTPAPSRAPDVNGWYNRGLTVAFPGTDATSGIATCTTTQSYSGPDNATASVAGSCSDLAGNAAPKAFALKYDATAPAVTAAPARSPNANGWFNAAVNVGFTATDATAGVGTCDAAKSYSGPDTVMTSISGSCSDQAGNTGSASAALKYDATAPTAAAAGSRAPDANGWYRAALTVNVGGTDLTSGIASCTAPQAYGGPDTAAVSLSGSCTDRAGNGSAASVFGFKYDATAPQVTTAAAARPPDRAPWYNRPVAFSVQGTDATSGLDACPALTYRGPDAASASALGTCLDKAGNVGSKAFPIAYDGTGPAVTATPTRPPDANDWYRGPLSVSFVGSDGVSGLESCDGPSAYDGPDTTLAVVGGTCLDKAGNVGLASLSVRYDATPPQVTGAAADRAPDAAGWYNHALVVNFQGRDETSGIQSCTQAPYAGPDAGAASVAGSCADRAGNGSGPLSFALRYDGTAPSLSGIRVKTGNRRAELSWTASPDTIDVEIRRGTRVVYQGAGTSFADTNLENGVNYRYTLRAFDEARNAASSTVSARPTAPLFAPLGGAVVTAPPRLAWKPVAGATHYQVQLWRRGRVLTAWPRAASFQLKRSWTYAGRRYKLTPGRYRWFVWPGFKQPRSGKYGTILGSSTFVVREPKTRR